MVGVKHDALGGFGGQPLAPALPGDHVRDFYLGVTVDRPRKQPAPAEELATATVYRGPKPKLRVLRMTKAEPLQFELRLRMGTCLLYTSRCV